MDRTESAFLVACMVIIAFSAAYFINPPSPRYYPREHTWRMEKLENEPSMGWYGRTAWGVGAAVLAAVVTGLATRSANEHSQTDETGEESGLPTWAVGLLTLLALAAPIIASIEVIMHGIHKWGVAGPWEM